LDFVERIFTNVNNVAIEETRVEADSNALGEEETFEIGYASRLFNLFNFHVLKDFLNPC
jgi:hypothetical protein